MRLPYRRESVACAFHGVALEITCSAPHPSAAGTIYDHILAPRDSSAIGENGTPA
jgi:hypothetical protein